MYKKMIISLLFFFSSYSAVDVNLSLSQAACMRSSLKGIVALQADSFVDLLKKTGVALDSAQEQAFLTERSMCFSTFLSKKEWVALFITSGVLGMIAGKTGAWLGKKIVKNVKIDPRYTFSVQLATTVVLGALKIFGIVYRIKKLTEIPPVIIL